MSENEKGFGSKLIGLFVESKDSEEAPEGNKSAADLVAELAAQSGAQPVKPGEAPPPPPMPSNLKTDKMAAAPGAPTDFDAIFKDAGMDVAELDRVKKAEELLKGLPESTP